jgi:Fur family peroxide stress response transcriptional regulator
MIYERVKERIPNISLGTVYRNLTLLADLGEIARLHLGDGVDHFDYNAAPHYHFVCSRCGGVSDLETPDIKVVDTDAFQNFGGEIHGYSVHFHGVCPNCKGSLS